MISIHTNLSSLAVQNNLAQSTKGINTAIERMSTGYKINHAGDNAANYSISQNMNAQLSACDIAADNISMGMDLLSVAQDTIAGMQDRGSRIHALITQARNGTYGADSLNAMTQEANALVSEINRLYINTEYNGIKLFDGIKLPDWAKEVKANAGVDAGTINGKSLEQCAAEHNGFIAEVIEDTPDVTVTDPTQLASAISSNTKIGIGNAQTLAKLAELVNSGTTCEGKTIILTENIDLSAYQEGEGWTPVGTEENVFQGTFNGNGHKVTGLYINRSDSAFQGLFGKAGGEIKNIGVENANITGRMYYTGGLVGSANTITNSYATGNVSGMASTGGLAGSANTIANSYAAVTVTGNGSDTGGLIGHTSGTITDSYATGDVTGSVNNVGGLTGWADGDTITNCYATGNVTGKNGNTGGLAGRAGSNIANSYATGNVSNNDTFTGGLVGMAMNTITNSYSTGNVTGTDKTGGLAGTAKVEITNSYATGSVTGNDYTGGLVGQAQGAITNSYATGDVTGIEWVGGLVGRYMKTSGTVTNENILSSGNVSGSDMVGSLIGGIVNTSNGSSFSTITFTNASARSGGNMIGFEGTSGGIAYESGQMDGWLENIEALETLKTTLQVGIHSGEDSQISVDTSLSFSLSISDLTSDRAYNSITNFLDKLSQKATELGAAQNRLESALESNMVQMDNLTSSLSTIRDADISEVSSDFIRQQILQQAAATLLSTANQSPAIALQLI